MQKIKREVNTEDSKIYTIKTIGFNNNGVLSIVCSHQSSPNKEVIFNFNGQELIKLLDLTRKIDIQELIKQQENYKQKHELYCYGCKSENYPNHNKGCMEGDKGWIEKEIKK